MTSAIRHSDFVSHVFTPVWDLSASVQTKVNWDHLTRARRYRLANGDRPASIEVLAWNTVESLPAAVVGVAVTRSGGGVAVAIAGAADSFPLFCAALREQIEAVRKGLVSSTIPEVLVTTAATHQVAPAEGGSAATLHLAPPKIWSSRDASLTLHFKRHAFSEFRAAKLLRDITDGIAATPLSARPARCAGSC